MTQAFPTIADFTVLDFELWVLVLVRVAFMIAFIPVVGSSNVPMKVKAGLSVFMSIIIYGVMPEVKLTLPGSLLEFFTLALKEIYVGMVMAASSQLVFTAVNIAGRIIDINAGFGMIQSVNPMTDTDESATGQLLFIIFSFIMIVTGAHLFFLRIVAESFQVIPVMSANFSSAGIAKTFIIMTSMAFTYGIKLAAPVMVPLLLSTAGLAVVSKLMPQINVWLVGMPLKIMLAMGTIAFVLPLMWIVFKKNLFEIEVYHMGLLKLMGG